MGNRRKNAPKMLSEKFDTRNGKPTEILLEKFDAMVGKWSEKRYDVGKIW